MPDHTQERMKIKVKGKKIKDYDYIYSEIEIDINDLYKTLKEYGFEILGWNDSRRIKCPTTPKR